MAKFLISFTILALLFPYMLIGTINDLYYDNTYLQFFIVLFASFKLAYLSSFKYQNIIQITFWIYIYIFLGIVSLLQLLTNTFPWKGEYSSDIISSSQLIIIVGLFSYELGIMINQKIKFSKNKHKILKGIQLSNKNYIILTFIFILIAFLALQNLGGFDTLISARNDKYTIIKEILPQTILSILDGLVKTVPVTILLMSILMYQFSIFNSKKFFIYLIFLLLVVLFLNNPISTPRYQVGTLILSILFILFWGKMKAYFFVFLFIFSLLFIVPYSDAFRKSTDVSLEDLKKKTQQNTLLEKGDFDSFQMILNTTEVVEKHGITYGKQFISSILFMVPRVIWNNKGKPTSVYIAEQKNYRFNNLSCPLFAEFFVDGSWFFLFIGMLLYGYITSFLEKLKVKLEEINQFNYIYIFIIFFAAYQIYFLRGALMPILANLSLVPFTLYIYYFFSTKIKNEK